MEGHKTLLLMLLVAFLAKIGEGGGDPDTKFHPGRKGHVIARCTDFENICTINDGQEKVVIKDLACSMKHRYMIIQEKRGFYCAVLTNRVKDGIGMETLDRLLFDKGINPETDICSSIQIVEETELELKVKLSMSEFSEYQKDIREQTYHWTKATLGWGATKPASTDKPTPAETKSSDAKPQEQKKEDHKPQEPHKEDHKPQEPHNHKPQEPHKEDHKPQEPHKEDHKPQGPHKEDHNPQEKNKDTHDAASH